MANVNLGVIYYLPPEKLRKMREFPDFEDNMRALFSLVGKLPTDTSSIDSGVGQIALEDLLSPLRNLAYKTGHAMELPYRSLFPYFSGLQNVVASYFPERAPDFKSDSIYTERGTWFKVAEMPLQPTLFVPRMVQGRPMVVPDRLDTMKEYLTAVQKTINERMVDYVDGNVVPGPFAFLAPDVSLSLLGSAEGFKRIYQQLALEIPSLGTVERDDLRNREEHLNSLAKKALTMSGLANTPYVANKLLELGDPTPLEMVRVPPNMYNAFLSWMQAGMPGTRR